MKIWLITGASSGFGKVLAGQLLARGDRVVATARQVADVEHFARDYPETAAVTSLDVTQAGAAAAAVRLAAERFGSLDVLVNAAGFGFVGAIEEATPDEYRPMFETNLFGLIETIRAALPVLRASARATIVNFSSGAGIAGGAGSGHYCATKFAVEGLSEALAQEVGPLGMTVIIAEPGPFRTEFLGRSIAMAAREIDAYADTAGKRRAYTPGRAAAPRRHISCAKKASKRGRATRKCSRSNGRRRSPAIWCERHAQFGRERQITALAISACRRL